MESAASQSRQLLEVVKSSSSEIFEHLIVNLLVMGHDGSRRETGEAVGRSGDEGIDGIIHEDRFGLDTGHTGLNSCRRVR